MFKTDVRQLDLRWLDVCGSLVKMSVTIFLPTWLPHHLTSKHLFILHLNIFLSHTYTSPIYTSPIYTSQHQNNSLSMSASILRTA